MKTQPKYNVRVWTNAQTHDAVSELQAAGYTVDNVEGMFRCKEQDLLLFTALRDGRSNYMIRYIHDLFGEDNT